ncbi:MAG: metallophosphoesterase [Alphaproteobacteria bacterium]|nr:metallophosphoesterase [Alphaproteobacteria bacterium]
MKILFIGDIAGRAGRDALEKHLPTVKEQYKPDVIIVNVDNAAGGYGVTEKVAQEIYGMGAHCLTTGDHVWDKREIVGYIERDKNMIRAANFPAGAFGRGTWEHVLPNGKKILIVHLIGRVFMPPLDCPFVALDNILKNYTLGKNVHAIFVDMHAEATSEKMAIAHFVDGRVSAVVGTHTHIPTNDAHILAGGTAYQTDAGMTGDYDSVIGMKKDMAVYKMMKKMPTEKLSPAEGEGTVCGTFIETDDSTGLAKSIIPIKIGGILGR